MIDSIEKAVNPLSLIIFIFGCGILRYPLDQPRYRLSIFYILILWSVYACAIYYIKIQFSSNINISRGFPTFFPVITNLFVTLISIIITVCEHEKFYICIRKLDLVNDTLEELGTFKEYHRLRNLIKWVLITLFFMTCVSWTFDFLLCIEVFNDTIRAVIIPFVLDYSIQMYTIMDIMFMLLLRHIGSRLDKINDHIIQLSETDVCDIQFKWKKSFVVNRYNIRSTENHKRVLWTLIHLHLELCRIARDINGFFGTQMTLQMLTYFIALIGMFNFEYYIILHLKEISKNALTTKVLLCSNMWFFIFLVKLLSVNLICENVSAKAQRTNNVINRLTNLICFAEIREEISQFVLQILLQPLKFSGLGMFYFGYDFIRKFFVWILAAVLFMVQMDIAPISHNLFTYNATYND